MGVWGWQHKVGRPICSGVRRNELRDDDGSGGVGFLQKYSLFSSRHDRCYMYYFFCKRGRKYINSVRPNRVTGSGFWKATGIDRLVYSHEGQGRDCIGLEKTLVYYRGNAGKGTKTDWMMHGFRLPTNENTTTINVVLPDAKVSSTQEAVRTLRI
ncbi:hypothetical protein Tsubulata_047950 [Turnera subulata]|uniref:NAC domain-containing protein n=1 Tax=Turnera subulata TaxID=218843 RepID=A0A9Q0J175_9ROSI|nr:hypothetical protein Tsubulata_047950 [Turnera subulata]